MVEEFTKSQLCCVGDGELVHIRKGERTYCGRGKLANLDWPGLIGMTERAKELCRSCLRAFKASKRQ